MIDTHIGPYVVQDKIGAGAMAAVYKAYDWEKQTTVALKVLHSQWAHDPNLVRRFQHEAEIASRLTHPNIIKVFGFGKSDETVYLAMEYMPAGSLDSHFKQPYALTVDASSKILRQVAAGLDYAHQESVIHRDLKMGNILVGDNGRLVISDFGVARALELTRLTATGSLTGTPLYMSPEQASGKSEVDYRSDLYSLAVMAYVLATGYYPFTASDVLALLNQHLLLPPPLPTDVNPELPEAVNGVLLKGLAKHPEDRYKTADDFVADFERSLRGQRALKIKVMTQAPNPSASSTTHTHVIPPPRRQRRSPLLVIIPVILLALIAAGVVLSRNNAAPPTSAPTVDPLEIANGILTQTAQSWTSTPSPTSTSMPSVTPSETPLATMIGYVSGEQGDNLRRGPSMNYDIITILPYQTEIQLLYRTEDVSWLEVVTADHLQGWVSRNLVQTDGNVLLLPIISLQDVTPISSENTPSASESASAPGSGQATSQAGQQATTAPTSIQPSNTPPLPTLPPATSIPQPTAIQPVATAIAPIRTVAAPIATSIPGGGNTVGGSLR